MVLPHGAMWYKCHVATYTDANGVARGVEDWFGPVLQSSAGGGADPDVVNFRRWAAGEPERIRLSSMGTLTRQNQDQERRW